MLPEDDYDSIERSLWFAQADDHGLTVLPFWSGERSPGWSLSARFDYGLTSNTQPIEILRAAMEAVAYRFALIARALEPFAPDANIVASGNALRGSATWVQILADVLGTPITVAQHNEASTRGAALLALEAAGKIENIETRNSVSGTTFDPIWFVMNATAPQSSDSKSATNNFTTKPKRPKIIQGQTTQ